MRVEGWKISILNEVFVGDSIHILQQLSAYFQKVGTAEPGHTFDNSSPYNSNEYNLHL